MVESTNKFKSFPSNFDIYSLRYGFFDHLLSIFCPTIIAGHFAADGGGKTTGGVLLVPTSLSVTGGPVIANPARRCHRRSYALPLGQLLVFKGNEELLLKPSCLKKPNSKSVADVNRGDDAETSSSAEWSDRTVTNYKCIGFAQCLQEN